MSCLSLSICKSRDIFRVPEALPGIWEAPCPDTHGILQEDIPRANHQIGPPARSCRHRFFRIEELVQARYGLDIQIRELRKDQHTDQQGSYEHAHSFRESPH